MKIVEPSAEFRAIIDGINEGHVDPRKIVGYAVVDGAAHAVDKDGALWALGDSFTFPVAEPIVCAPTGLTTNEIPTIIRAGEIREITTTMSTGGAHKQNRQQRRRDAARARRK